MNWDVFVEWKVHRQRAGRREFRDYERAALIAAHMYRATHSAASRVIAAVSAMMGGDGKIEFDYSLLPSIKDMMPDFDATGPFTQDEDGDDLSPLDPEKMTREQWDAMFSDVRQWQQFTSGTGIYAR